MTDRDAPASVRRAYLGIGSNIGDRAAHLQAAVDGLAAEPAVAVVAVSPVYETTPVGGPPQSDYLNAVVAVDTALTPRGLLELAMCIEAGEHRVRLQRWGPRTLDVDVLLVGHEEVHDADLEVPHPRMMDRAFVVVPLSDLDPAFAARAATEESCDQAGLRRSGVVLRVPE